MNDEACDVCLLDASVCECPVCQVCGATGDPHCYDDATSWYADPMPDGHTPHGLSLSPRRLSDRNDRIRVGREIDQAFERIFNDD